VLFSHSAIQADGGLSVDLLPFALTLAHAGAVVIVPERSLLWLPTGRSTNREGAVVICAEHWLFDHTKVFNNGAPTVNDENRVVRWGYAYVGPRLCDPAVPSDWDSMSPFASGAVPWKPLSISLINIQGPTSGQGAEGCRCRKSKTGTPTGARF
jgi:hypothetical protein